MSGKTSCGGDFIAFDGVEVFCANCSCREADDCVECFAEESHFDSKDLGLERGIGGCGLCGENGAAGVGDILSLDGKMPIVRSSRYDWLVGKVREAESCGSMNVSLLGLREVINSKIHASERKTFTAFKEWNKYWDFNEGKPQIYPNIPRIR